MKKLALVLVLTLSALSLFATQTFDIGGGRSLVLNEDGTYEIVSGQTSASVPSLAGSQYTLDIEALRSFLVEIAIASDPSLAMLGEELINSIIDYSLMSEELNISFIFLNDERVIMIFSDEDPVETTYYIDGSRRLYFNELDSSSSVLIGLFNEDYSSITLSDDSGMLIKLSRVE